MNGWWNGVRFRILFMRLRFQRLAVTAGRFAHWQARCNTGWRIYLEE